MTIEPNPFNWSANVKNLAALLAVVSTILGASWKAADAIGNKIYAFAEGQTTIIRNVEGIEKYLKEDLVPRVSKLETDASSAKTDAATTKQHVDDMGRDLQDIKSLAEQNLNVSRGHDADIRATRDAVAPRKMAPSPY